MGFFDKVKQVADQAHQMARSMKTELETRGIDIDGDDEASRRRRAEQQVQEARQNNQDIIDYLGFDPCSLVDDAAVSSAVGFDVQRSGNGGGDFEIGPAYRGTAKHDERSLSICFLYPEDLHSATWTADEQAEYYATAGDQPLSEWTDIGDRAWLVSEEMIVVLVRDRAFYIYGSGEKPGRPTIAGLKQVARLFAEAVPVSRS